MKQPLLSPHFKPLSAFMLVVLCKMDIFLAQHILINTLVHEYKVYPGKGKLLQILSCSQHIVYSQCSIDLCKLREFIE